jgi:hypothetical protein
MSCHAQKASNRSEFGALLAVAEYLLAECNLKPAAAKRLISS